MLLIFAALSECVANPDPAGRGAHCASTRCILSRLAPQVVDRPLCVAPPEQQAGLPEGRGHCPRASPSLASPALPTRPAAPPARLGPPSTRPGPGLGVGGPERGLTFQPSRKTPRVLVLVLDLRPPHAGWLRKILVHSPELLVAPPPLLSPACPSAGAAATVSGHRPEGVGLGRKLGPCKTRGRVPPSLPRRRPAPPRPGQ